MAIIDEQIKAAALKNLADRQATKPVQIDNSSLPAGWEMYFYCSSCGHVADIKPETYLFPPYKMCSECAGMKEEGWIK